MVGGTKLPPQDSVSEPWGNEQSKEKTKPFHEGKKQNLRPLVVSLDNADTVIEGGPRLRVKSALLHFFRLVPLCGCPGSRGFRDPGEASVWESCWLDELQLQHAPFVHADRTSLLVRVCTEAAPRPLLR